MTSIDELKAKRIKELEESSKDNMSLILHKILEPAALQRLNNVKAVKPDVASQLETYLLQVYQSGQLKSMISEDILVQILDKLNPKKDFNIRRK
jgi:programmed cell death protein 5